MNDIQELIGEARTAVRKLHPLGTSPMDDRVLALADALEALNRENEELRDNRGWDGDWRTLGQTEGESRRILMTWTKAQLVAHVTMDQQRSISHENFLISRMQSAEAERDALRATRDSMTTEWEYGWAADEERRKNMSPRGPRIMIDGLIDTPENLAAFPKGERIRRVKAGPWVEVTDE